MKNYIILFILVFSQNVFSQTEISGLGGTTQSTCGELFVTSQGGAASYGDGENVTFTICPDAGADPDDFISLDFSSFNLDVTNDGVNPNDRLIIYDGDDNTAPIIGTYFGSDLNSQSVISATAANASACLTVQLISNTVNDASTIYGFSFFATCAIPCSPPTAIGEVVNGVTTDSILVCPGEVVEFMENGSTAQTPFSIINYSWNFDDGSSTAGSMNGTVNHTYNEPGYYEVELTVQDDNSDVVCVNNVQLKLKVFVATPPTFFNFPQDTTLCIGEALILDAQVELYDSTFTDFPDPTEVPFPCLDDDQGVTQSNTIPQDQFIIGSTITDVGDIQSICLEMEHSWIGDLVIEVVCPNGQSVVLHNQGGGGTLLGEPIDDDNTPVICNPESNIGVLYTYCFEPYATTTWAEWAANNNGTLPAGGYESSGDLSGLIGCPLNGNWRLEITDNFSLDDGFVDLVYINMNPDLYIDVLQFTPKIGDDSDSSYWDLTDTDITNISADGNEVTITPLTAGTNEYTYTVVDDFGCTNDSTFEITVDAPIFADAGPNLSVVCPGESEVIGPPSPQCSNDGGSYSYCYDSDENTTFTYCPDNPGDGLTFMEIAFTAGSVETGWDELYIYDGNDITAPQIGGVVDGNLAGLSFLATNPTGCITMELISDFSVSCASGSEDQWEYEVSCGNSGTEVVYNWSPDDGTISDAEEINPTATPNLTTTYTLSVYPVGHPDCVNSDDMEFTVTTIIDPGLDSSAILCLEGLPVDLFDYVGGTPELGGVWFNPIGNQISMPIRPDTIAAGFYEYRKYLNGCFASSFIEVTIQQLGLTATINHSDCNALNGEITLNPIGAIGPTTYSNDLGVNFVANNVFTEGMQMGILTGLGSGNIYNFMAKDSIGCIASIDSIVIDDSFPVIDPVTITIVDSDCGIDNGQITAVTTNGGTPNYEYSVNGTNFFTLPIIDLANGDYTITVEDNFGCTSNELITITDINLPLITNVTKTDVTCNDIGNGTILIEGDNLMSYKIIGPNGTLSQNGNGLFENLVPGLYDITAYSGINEGLCDDTYATQILIEEPNELTIIEISNSVTVCGGEEVELTAEGMGGNGNYTYTWLVDNQPTYLGQTIFLTAEETTEICLLLTEDCPSPSPALECVNVNVSPAIYPSMETDVVDGCYPLEVQFINTSTGGTVTSTTWELQNEYQQTVPAMDNITYTYNNPGVFNVLMTVVSNGGCVFDTAYSQYITVHDHPEVNFTYNPNPMDVYNTEAQFLDYTDGNDSIFLRAWEFGEGIIPTVSGEKNPIALYPKGVAAVYPVQLTVWNEHGCVDSLLSQVEVINDVTIFAPNAFTPDGDAFNEDWRVYINGIDIYDYHCLVFNRWGEIVYESYDPESTWNGSYGNVGDVPDGTYVWTVYANNSFNDEKYEFSGTVNVLR